MRNNNADPYNQENRSNDARSSNQPQAAKMDLSDSPRDQAGHVHVAGRAPAQQVPPEQQRVSEQVGDPLR